MTRLRVKWALTALLGLGLISTPIAAYAQGWHGSPGGGGGHGSAGGGWHGGSPGGYHGGWSSPSGGGYVAPGYARPQPLHSPAYGPSIYGPRTYVAPRSSIVVAPRAHVWVPGYWGYNAGARVWIGGSWAYPPYAGWVWVSPQWTWNGYQWVWSTGYWAPPY
jgi:hypothetical protein